MDCSGRNQRTAHKSRRKYVEGGVHLRLVLISDMQCSASRGLIIGFQADGKSLISVKGRKEKRNLNIKALED